MTAAPQQWSESATTFKILYFLLASKAVCWLEEPWWCCKIIPHVTSGATWDYCASFQRHGIPGRVRPARHVTEPYDTLTPNPLQGCSFAFCSLSSCPFLFPLEEGAVSVSKPETLWSSKNRRRLPVQVLATERKLEKLQMKLKLKDTWSSGKRVEVLESNFGLNLSLASFQMHGLVSFFHV